MADGTKGKLLRKVLHESSQLLLLQPEIASLPDEQRAAILQEFGRARQHLQMTFAIKF